MSERVAQAYTAGYLALLSKTESCISIQMDVCAEFVRQDVEILSSFTHQTQVIQLMDDLLSSFFEEFPSCSSSHNQSETCFVKLHND